MKRPLGQSRVTNIKRLRLVMWGPLCGAVLWRGELLMGEVEVEFCQPKAKAKAKAMPGRLFIHTIYK